jgi:hypothetical protein
LLGGVAALEVDVAARGDGVQPARGGGVSRHEAPARDQRGRERLGSQVGGGLAIGDAAREVALDAVQVARVEDAERLGVDRGQQLFVGGVGLHARSSNGRGGL